MKKLLIQCDFDGTILEEDISFLILQKYYPGDWQYLDRLYNNGTLNVAQFNEQTFGQVKAGYAEQMQFIKGKEKPRPGFKKLVALCKERNIRFVVVSNGFEFYIEPIFKHLGVGNIEYHGGKVHFDNSGMRVEYFDSEGKRILIGFKDSYTDKFLKEGYEIIYIGDGMSDLSPAKKCQTIFARDSLQQRCQKAGVPYLLFNDFYDIIKFLNHGK